MFSGKRIKSRHKRSLYLSAARSYLFNYYLSNRVAAQSWNKAIPGDVMQLSGSNSFFSIEELDDEIENRISSFDIHPTGVMWGRGITTAQLEAHKLELNIKTTYPHFCDGLEKAGLDISRRSLRLIAENLTWIMDLDKKQLQRLALDITNKAREFNLREGMSKVDDTLPDRFFKEKLEDSGKVLLKADFEKMRSDYYNIKGWD